MSRTLTRQSVQTSFYGWWIVAACFVTFGIAVGVPYYNLPFFYDYFQQSFHWKITDITLGFPLAALLTIWAGPLLVPRISPRKLLVIGTGLTALSFAGFSRMNGSLLIYFLLYFIYTIGYICSGPIPHQLLVSYWFQQRRGRAMGIAYVGVGLCAGLGSFLVRFVTAHFGFRAALLAVGALMFAAWPLALFVIRDRPAELDQYPDGLLEPPPDTSMAALPLRELWRSRAFWLLLIGSICSIGAIGCVNLHMKFVFRDAGFTNQHTLDVVWATASVIISWVSISGRLSIGYFADILSKKLVMTVTYFLIAITILLLFSVSVKSDFSVYIFAVLFGFAMGADYMLIPLMAAEQFGVNTLSRAMAIILPLNTIGQTWFPQLVSFLRQRSGSYTAPLTIVFALALIGALAIAVLPRRSVLDPTPTRRNR